MSICIISHAYVLKYFAITLITYLRGDKYIKTIKNTYLARSPPPIIITNNWPTEHLFYHHHIYKKILGKKSCHHSNHHSLPINNGGVILAHCIKNVTFVWQRKYIYSM